MRTSREKVYYHRNNETIVGLCCGSYVNPFSSAKTLKHFPKDYLSLLCKHLHLKDNKSEKRNTRNHIQNLVLKNDTAYC